MSELWGDPRLETDDDALVLVVVLTSPRDLAIAREQGWYRIPVKRAPRRVAADYLAFYQTRAFGEEAYAVRYYAPVRRFHVARRAELLPDEPDHPRWRGLLSNRNRLAGAAGTAYPQPPAAPHYLHPHHVQTVPGSRGDQRPMVADEPQERLWAALREAGLQVEYRYRVGEPPDEVQVDFALFCRNGRIAVLCDDQPTDGQIALRERRPAEYALVAAGWHVVRFSQEELDKTLPACLSAVLALVNRLGGQDA